MEEKHPINCSVVTPCQYKSVGIHFLFPIIKKSVGKHLYLCDCAALFNFNNNCIYHINHAVIHDFQLVQLWYGVVQRIVFFLQCK